MTTIRTVTVQDIIDAVETIAPPLLAMESDRPRIGLHCGSPAKPVKRAALALDASLAAIDAAKKSKADILIVHHPRFWVKINNLVESDPSGRRAIKMLESNLAVYSAHTNLDAAPGGTNDLLAVAAGLSAPDVVEPVYRERLLKLTVFTPASHTRQMVKALDRAGAGALGNYTGCSFRARGTGTFRCGPGTNPYQGKPGSYEEADEYRIETVFGELSREAVVSAMLSTHPYEEPAYDMYPVLGSGRVYGLGRVGDLSEPETVRDLAQRMSEATGSTETRFSGRPLRKVRRVAVWAGAGAPLERFVACGAEAVITGEIGYHDVESFDDAGVAVIAVGHGRSEELVLPPLARMLKKLVPGVDFTTAGKGFISMTNV